MIKIYDFTRNRWDNMLVKVHYAPRHANDNNMYEAPVWRQWFNECPTDSIYNYVDWSELKARMNRKKWRVL